MLRTVIFDAVCLLWRGWSKACCVRAITYPLAVFAIYLMSFPITKLLVARTAWYAKAAQDLKFKGSASIGGFTVMGGGSSGGGSSDGGGFSGGGGGSGGGGASGSW